MNAGGRNSGYSLEIENPRTSATTFETYVCLAAVIARAAELIKAGYSVGIWSTEALELRSGDPVAANDDVRIDALGTTLTG